jgi:hypothetical protein
MDFPVSSSSSPASTPDSDASFDYQLPICPPVLSSAIPLHHRHPHHRHLDIAHPYARLFAKKDEVKRRKIWNHALEKFIFSSYELYLLFSPTSLVLMFLYPAQHLAPPSAEQSTLPASKLTLISYTPVYWSKPL